jgi:hypothetical protein
MQLLGQNYFAKKLQSQTVIREKMGKTLLYTKKAQVNCTSSFFRQKITVPYCMQALKRLKNTFVPKNARKY